MFKRMIVGELINKDQLRLFTAAVLDYSQTPQVMPGFARFEFSSEDDGNMVAVEIVWQTRDQVIADHISKAYRTFVANTEHLLAGSFVVKLLHVVSVN
jgi:heme-degrading monooxygenase HmoA